MSSLVDESMEREEEDRNRNFQEQKESAIRRAENLSYHMHLQHEESSMKHFGTSLEQQDKDYKQKAMEVFIRKEIERLGVCLNSTYIVNEVTIPNFDEKTQLPPGVVDLSRNFTQMQKVMIHDMYSHHDWDIAYCIAKNTDAPIWAPTFSFVFKFIKETQNHLGKIIIVTADGLAPHEIKEALYTVKRMQGFWPLADNKSEEINALIDKTCLEEAEKFCNENQPKSDLRLVSKEGRKIKCTSDELKDLRLWVNGVEYKFASWWHERFNSLCFGFEDVKNCDKDKE